MKLWMIPSTMLPFPPVKGGAVQNLIKSYVVWNENNAKDEVYIVSIYDQEAEKEAREWNYCNVIYIKLPQILFRLRDSNIKLCVRFGIKFIHLIYMYKLRKLLQKRTNDADLIILDNTPQFCKDVYKASGKNVCIHIYNDYLNEDTEGVNEILARTQKVITVSDYISQRVIKTKLIEPNDVLTLHNGIELSKFGKKESIDKRLKLRNQYGIAEDATVFIFVARLVPEKGIKQLIEAFNKIDDAKAHLVVVGNKLYSGTIKDSFLLELQKLAEYKNTYIHFTGYVDYSNLPDYYAMADVGVLPSLYEEPFALAAIEYMASGLAVILSDAGGFPEMVENGSAILVHRGERMVDELKEKMELLLDNKELLEAYKKQGKLQSQKFNAESYCTNLHSILEKINDEKIQ